MILTRIKRGAARTSVLVGLKLENFARTPLRSTLNLVRKATLHALVLPLVVTSIPMHSTAPVALAAEDSEPSSTFPLIKAGTVKTEVDFNPLGLQEQNALPFTSSSSTLAQVTVGKSIQTEQEEYQAQLAAKQAAEEAARKAEAEAAAKKAAEEARIRKEQEAQAARAAAQKAAVAAIPVGSVQEIAYAMTVQRFGESHWNAMWTLIMRESGGNPLAKNARSGACGLGQALPCSKMPQGINTPVEGQVQWMLNYVANRYGTPNNALAFWNVHRWY